MPQWRLTLAHPHYQHCQAECRGTLHQCGSKEKTYSQSKYLLYPVYTLQNYHLGPLRGPQACEPSPDCPQQLHLQHIWLSLDFMTLRRTDNLPALHLCTKAISSHIWHRLSICDWITLPNATWVDESNCAFFKGLPSQLIWYHHQLSMSAEYMEGVLVHMYKQSCKNGKVRVSMSP